MEQKFVFEKHTFDDVRNVFENYILSEDAKRRIQDAFDYMRLKMDT